MSVNITPATLPSDTDFPTSVQALLNLIAGNLTVDGFTSFAGVIVSSTEPSADNRDRVWIQTDPTTGAPTATRIFNAGAWATSPSIIESGDTADRPTSPITGQQFFDTEIGVALVYERAKWRTLSGVTGDIKYVRASTLDAAIEKNPGWVGFSEGLGRVIAGAGAGEGLTTRAALDSEGAETHKLTETQLPVITPTFTVDLSPNYTQSGGNFEGAPGSGQATKTVSCDSFGGGTAHPNMQPTVFMWALEKE